MQKIYSGEGSITCLDEPGGTGKTFLINLILAEVLSKGDIALATSTSGIAGCTAHPTFKLRLDLTRSGSPTCHIPKQSEIAKLLRQCKVILWKSVLRHTNRLLKHWTFLRGLRDSDKIMGGVCVISAGDLRQTLPVIQRGSVTDEINTCFKMSKLWRAVHKLKLTKNMRVLTNGDTLAEDFFNKLLQIENGQITPHVSGQVNLHENFCVTILNPRELNDKVYPDIENKCVLHGWVLHYADYFNWLCERIISALRIDNVNQINLDILKELPGDIASFTSYNKTLEDENPIRFPTEFFLIQKGCLECFSTSSSFGSDLRLFVAKSQCTKLFAMVHEYR